MDGLTIALLLLCFIITIVALGLSIYNSIKISDIQDSKEEEEEEDDEEEEIIIPPPTYSLYLHVPNPEYIPSPSVYLSREYGIYNELFDSVATDLPFSYVPLPTDKTGITTIHSGINTIYQVAFIDGLQRMRDGPDKVTGDDSWSSWV